MSEKTGEAKKGVDKTSGDVKDCVQAAEKAPPAVVQDMINHRRQLKAMLSYTERFLTKYGVKLN